MFAAGCIFSSLQSAGPAAYEHVCLIQHELDKFFKLLHGRIFSLITL